ncbi:hypothetical protein LTSERUB_3512, partial [Salmonella enterica subsp. enterica serovar Rubislaw str. A4-653]
RHRSVATNETWARVLHPDAAGNPDKGGCAANRSTCGR